MTKSPRETSILLDLPFALKKPKNYQHWVNVFEQIESGDMPPEKKPRPSSVATEQFLESLKTPLIAAVKGKIESEGRVKVRRLTRREYEHTIHDLLGIDIPLIDHLPKEPGGHIFETTASDQQISQHLLARYLDTAEMALNEAFDRVIEGDKKYTKTIGAYKLGRGSWRGGNYRGLEDKGSRAISWPLRLQFYGRMPATRVPESGWYQIKIKGVQSVNKDIVWGTLKSGACSSSAPVLFQIGNIEATKEKRDLVYQAWIQKDHMLELKPADATTPRAQIKTKGGSVSFKGTNLEKDGTHGIAVSEIEMTRIYPYGKRWEIRKILFGEVAKEAIQNASPEARVQMIKKQVRRFANRAFRRPVNDKQIAPYQSLAVSRLKEKGAKPVDALFTAYRAILCSPRFLTFYEKPGWLDQHALATRLSYMLWNSMPDQQLRALADKGELKGKKVHDEVYRMLNNSKAERFIASYTDQWLKLKEIDFTSPDTRRFRTFDQVVQQSIVDETRAYFRELIKNNHSVHHLIHSDFAMLNERLVRFYSMKDVKVKRGWRTSESEFEKQQSQWFRHPGVGLKSNGGRNLYLAHYSGYLHQ